MRSLGQLPHNLQLAVLEALVLQHLLDRDSLPGSNDLGLEDNAKGAIADDTLGTVGDVLVGEEMDGDVGHDARRECVGLVGFVRIWIFRDLWFRALVLGPWGAPRPSLSLGGAVGLSQTLPGALWGAHTASEDTDPRQWTVVAALARTATRLRSPGLDSFQSSP